MLTGTRFLSGDVAIAEGAIAAGCRFFAAYPITPSSQIAEWLSRRMPRVGGIFIQMEDELGSIGAVLGASWGGFKSMTATSGPGFSLMAEHIGLAIMLETPCVIVNVQRGGPATGLPTLPAQGDIMQARWGSHGHYEIIALAPSSPQEAFDLTVRAFNLAEQYRVPVILLADECVGHMFEKVVIPSQIELVERRRPAKGRAYLPYKAGPDGVPPMARPGDGFRFHVTGLTHDEHGYPAMSADAQDKLVRRLCEKIRRDVDRIVDVEQMAMDDADIALISYGSPARCGPQAIHLARAEGIRAGFIRLKTLWPFPEKIIRRVARQVKAFVVAEMNYGQIALEVERCASSQAEVLLVEKLGGEVHRAEEIVRQMREVS
jgi:2-oxoglutarate ferredoxin oxidoreductase subunit alpha